MTRDLLITKVVEMGFDRTELECLSIEQLKNIVFARIYGDNGPKLAALIQKERAANPETEDWCDT